MVILHIYVLWNRVKIFNVKNEGEGELYFVFAEAIINRRRDEKLQGPAISYSLPTRPKAG